MTIDLNTQVQKAFSRLENLSQCDLPSHELTSKLLSELNSALHELQTTTVELLEQNEEMAASRQTLEEERRRYQELFDFAPDGYLVTDTEGIILDANSAATNLFNVSKSLLIGKPLAIFVRSEEHLDLPYPVGRDEKRNRCTKRELGACHAIRKANNVSCFYNGGEGHCLQGRNRGVALATA